MRRGRHLRQHFVTVCSAASLLLCVAVCVLWASSYTRVYRVFFSPTGNLFFDVQSYSGSTVVYAGNGWPATAERLIANTHMVGPSWILYSRPALRVRANAPPFDWGNRWFGYRVGSFYMQFHLDGSVGEPFEGGVYQPEVRLPFRAIVLHDSVIAFALLVLPGLWLVRRRRENRAKMRRASGQCPACGYDLRATLGRCPECGAESTTPSGT